MNDLEILSPEETTGVSVQYDLCVFIGRFQPLHCGHESVLRMALQNATHALVLIGSANAPRSHRNPFTYEERVDMIFKTMGDSPQNIYCQGIEDSAYNDQQWVLDVQKAVDFCLDDIAESEGLSRAERQKMRVALIGHSKDHTSYYLSMFPAYDSIQAPNFKGLSSTQMRNSYFSNICDMWLLDCDGHREGDKTIDHLVSTPVRDFLIEFSKTPDYKHIRDEYDFIMNYKAQWASAPFPVTMVTTDAVVTQSGHILLVRRKGRPGRGTWALPGGYLKQEELIIDGMVRELVEETRIGVSKEELKKSIVGSRVFDEPHRDPRGRVITHAFRIDLPPRRTLLKITGKRTKVPPELADVEGADDAEVAKWWPLASVKREMMFSDHMDIIRAMLNSN